MKQFCAFFNSNFDAKRQAQAYADEASVHARAIGKTVSTQTVDTISTDPLLKYWDKTTTIQCVTVDDSGNVKDRVNNPPNLAIIDSMIDNL
jgi:hypothetical protein